MPSIVLAVILTDAPQVRFYEKVGFEVKDTLQTEALHGSFTGYWMSLRC